MAKRREGARAARPLSGWTRLSAARYRSPEGEEVSRRQYDNARLRAIGFKSRSEREKLAGWSTGEKLARDIAAKEGRSVRAVKRDPAFLRTAIGARREGMRGGPRSASARLLADAGLRDPGARNKIGEGYDRKRRRRK